MPGLQNHTGGRQVDMKMVSLERKWPKGREGLSLEWKSNLALGNSMEKNWDWHLAVAPR